MRTPARPIKRPARSVRVLWAGLALILLLAHSLEPVAFQAQLSRFRDRSVEAGLPAAAKSLLRLPRALIERAWHDADGARLARADRIEAARDAGKHFSQTELPLERLVRAGAPEPPAVQPVRRGHPPFTGTVRVRAPPIAILA